MLTKDEARIDLEDSAIAAMDAGMTKEEIRDSIEYILKNYEDES